MGQYTEHWAKYRTDSNRSTFRMLGVLLCLPIIALVGYGLTQFTEWALPALGVMLVAWLVVLVRLALSSSKVPCPRCSTVYSRGKFLCNCPHCGLRMLQEDPS
jgi:Mn2+/Fe2+ NRAMP family transporter